MQREESQDCREELVAAGKEADNIREEGRGKEGREGG